MFINVKNINLIMFAGRFIWTSLETLEWQKTISVLKYVFIVFAKVIA